MVMGIGVPKYDAASLGCVYVSVNGSMLGCDVRVRLKKCDVGESRVITFSPQPEPA